MEASLSDLTKESGEIQSFLELEPTEDVDELIARLSFINTYLARTGKMLADAKSLQDKATAAVFGRYAKSINQMPATIAQKFISSQTDEENYLVNWIDRLNRACTHIGENLRTQISYGKEQMKLTRSGY